MGGFHIGHPDMPDGDAVKLIHSAIDRGITFLDNCWDYNAGNSELRMGRALSVEGYRDRVFLMTKVDGRTKAAFDAQLEESMNRLLTDRLDLIQFTKTSGPTMRIASSLRAVRSKRPSRRARPVRCGSSASPATRIRSFICT